MGYALRTAAAVLAAIVVTAVVQLITSLIVIVVYGVTTVLRPEIVGFFAATLGAYAGVEATWLVAQRWLLPYSRLFVWLAYLTIVIGGVIFELFYVPRAWTQINSVAQLVVLAVMAQEKFGARYSQNGN